MTNFLIILIILTLIVGIIIIRNILIKIQKVREMGAHDYLFLKEIIVYLGKKEGFFDGCDKKD